MIKQLHVDAFTDGVKWSSKNVTEADEKLVSALNRQLPHGSGINADWHYQIGSRGIIRAYNTYSAMDEMGGYCHDHDFVVYAEYVNNEFVMHNIRMLERYHKCCSFGLRDYLSETVSSSLKE